MEHYTPEQREVLRVKPGMAGLTQVRFRHEETLLSHSTNLEEDYIEKIMPQKLALDLEYIQNQSLLLDEKLFMGMFLSLFQSDESMAEKE